MECGAPFKEARYKPMSDVEQMSDTDKGKGDIESERRELSEDRRSSSSVDRRSGWDRRRGPGRRRSTARRSAEEGEMNDDQFEFIMAIEDYKKANGRPFPSFTEILEIAKALGYRKVADPQPLNPESVQMAD